jgi:hypothetical protein
MQLSADRSLPGIRPRYRAIIMLAVAAMVVSGAAASSASADRWWDEPQMTLNPALQDVGGSQAHDRGQVQTLERVEVTGTGGRETVVTLEPVIITGTGHSEAPLPVITIFEFNKMTDAARANRETRDLTDAAAATAAAKEACLAKAASSLKTCQLKDNMACTVGAAMGTAATGIACADKVKLPVLRSTCIVGSAGAWGIGGVACAYLSPCDDWAKGDIQACNASSRANSSRPLSGRVSQAIR